MAIHVDIQAGSVPGTLHTRPGKPGWTNNHDAYAYTANASGAVGVVCDGCGSASHSEVGAKICASIITQTIATELAALRYGTSLEDKGHIFWRNVRDGVLSHIRILAGAMGEPKEVVRDYFLFTVVGFVVTGWEVYFFSIGDGMYAFNNMVVTLGPFEGNRPPYLAYNITGAQALDPNTFESFRVDTYDTSAFKTLCVGTDGVSDIEGVKEKNLPGKDEVVGPLSELWENNRIASNPDGIRRRLALMNRSVINREDIPYLEKGLLPDDTTLIVARRRTNKDGGET